MRTYLTRKFRAVTGKPRSIRSAAAAAAAALLEMLEPRQLLSTYYVSTSGSDAAAGTSITAPFNTIARVNALTLKPGDQVLFAGGQTFAGSIYVPSKEGGTATLPVVFSAYGTGRAT